jgi:hypothetical protein
VPDIVTATAKAFLARFGLEAGKSLVDIAAQVGLSVAEVDADNSMAHCYVWMGCLMELSR